MSQANKVDSQDAPLRDLNRNPREGGTPVERPTSLSPPTTSTEWDATLPICAYDELRPPLYAYALSALVQLDSGCPSQGTVVPIVHASVPVMLPSLFRFWVTRAEGKNIGLSGYLTSSNTPASWTQSPDSVKFSTLQHIITEHRINTISQPTSETVACETHEGRKQGLGN